MTTKREPLRQENGEPDAAGIREALNLFLGDWCANAASASDEEDQKLLSELEDALTRLFDTPHIAPLFLTARTLNTPLDALSVWDAIEKVARSSAILSAHEARRQGETWERIGEQGLISKSSALQRYDA